MTYRRQKQTSWHKAAQVLPIWSSANTDAANIVVKELLARIGVTDVKSYFTQLGFVIALCAVVGASMGASSHGANGLIAGALLGVVAPAFAIWICTVVVLVVVFLAVYCAAWAVIVYLASWILGSSFGA